MRWDGWSLAGIWSALGLVFGIGQVCLDIMNDDHEGAHFPFGRHTRGHRIGISFLSNNISSEMI